MKQFILEVLMGLAYAIGGGLIWANKPFWVWIWLFVIAGILMAEIERGTEQKVLLHEARKEGER